MSKEETSPSKEPASNAFTEANRKTFDDLSSRYDTDPWRQKMSATIAAGFHARKDWIGIRWAQDDDLQFGRETKLLDYACGTGSVTKAIGSWVTHVRGIDLSENMVRLFNETARASGVPEDRVKAVVGDLIGDEAPGKDLEGEEWCNFDICVVGLGFHHFENPMRAVQRLTERLKPGTGTLIIVDFLPFDVNEPGNAQEGAKQTIKHGGFARTNMEMLFKAAKLENFSFSVMEEPVTMVSKEGKETKRTVFFARGRTEPTVWGKMGKWLTGLQTTAGEQFSIKPREDVPDRLGLMGEKRTGSNQ